MKAFHRIRGCLLLLLVMPHALRSGPSIPPTPDFTPCFSDRSHYRCVVHDSCYLSTEGKFTSFRKSDDVTKCTRYLIVRSIGSESLEIEFRDDTLPKAPGAVVSTDAGKNIFKCYEKGGTMKITTDFEQKLKASPTDMQKTYAKLYCKFTLTAANTQSREEFAKFILDYVPGKINGISITDGMQISTLHFECNWAQLYKGDADANEDEMSYEGTTESTCPKPYFNRFKKKGEKEYKNVEPAFKCIKAVIKYQEIAGGPLLDAKEGYRKCTRPKCAKCECLFCDGGEGRPQFPEPDGKACGEIKCGKYMLLTPDNGPPFVHPNASLHCFHESGEHGTAKWGRSGLEGKEGYGKLLNATCIDEVDCAVLSPIASECPAPTEHEGMNCTKASLNGTEAPVCDADHETWYRPGAGIPSRVDSFACNGQTGSWKIANETYQRGSNVYCLKPIGDNGAGARSRPAGANAGTIIGAIVGVCVGIFIIVIIIVLCWRRKLLKKGNRDEMPSVSITGKKSKKKRGKKGSGSISTGSKTSEQISAPPPPPCPDSLNFTSEPEPHRPQSSAQPSSGGPASVPAVGPDTGKPDKPAELIDIKLESQKKDSTESKRAKPAQSDTTVVNTITGTSIASKVEPAKGTDASGRSDTGTGTGASGRKKKNKMELDKHGRGLTDDEEYNIDEGVKPINLEDKNKKPYKPAVDPNKQMINVTVTEDEDGKMKPKLKPSLF